MSQTDPGQVYRDAAELIRTHGHTRFAGQDVAGRYCLLGAVAAAKGWGAEAWMAIDDRHLRNTLDEFQPDWRERLYPFTPRQIEQFPVDTREVRQGATSWRWNDRLATKDEVIALLEKAAASAPVE